MKFRSALSSLSLLTLALAGCPPIANNTADVARSDASANPTDSAAEASVNEFANVPTCTVGGFFALQGALYMGAQAPSMLIADGRPTLTQTTGASSLSLADSTGGMAYLLRFEWNGTLAADQVADLSGAQLFLPRDQGASSPPLEAPWADRRICAGQGSRIALRATGMQFILRNWTTTTGACPSGEQGQDEIRGCYLPNMAP